MISDIPYGISLQIDDHHGKTTPKLTDQASFGVLFMKIPNLRIGLFSLMKQLKIANFKIRVLFLQHDFDYAVSP